MTTSAMNGEMHRQDSSAEKNRVCVEIRLMFLQIGNIETQSERFNAHVAIEAQWLADDSFLETLDDDILQRLSKDHAVPLSDDVIKQKQIWNPRLFLLNTTVSEENQRIIYSLKKSNNDDLSSPKIYVREHRLVKGYFSVPFRLHNYPSDVQELYVSIGSSICNDQIQLVAHPSIESGINREVFEGHQEWHLYEHVETRSKTIRGFVSMNDDDTELDKPGAETERTILIISCHAGRRSNYFFWNGYCIVFLLTAVAFSSFAITADATQQRLNIACTLLLSQIAFRWTLSVSHLLPPTYYLTTLDIYAITSMFVLIILGTWHAIIGSLIFTFNDSNSIRPGNYWLWCDRYVFFALGSLYILIHAIFIVCHLRGPCKYRRNMAMKDVRYRRKILGLNNNDDLSSKV